MVGAESGMRMTERANTKLKNTAVTAGHRLDRKPQSRSSSQINCEISENSMHEMEWWDEVGPTTDLRSVLRRICH